MPNQQRKIGDGPVRVKALRLGDGRDHHESLGCVAILYQPSGRNGRSPQRHKYTKCTTEPHPHSQPSQILWGNHCGPDDRDCHTHNLAEPLCPKRSRHHWHLQCTRAQHRDGVGMPDAGLHPHRGAMDKQHTEPRPSCCVPFGDPHVHKVTPSGKTRQGRNNSSANTLGGSPPYGEDTPDRRQVQRKEQKGVHQQRVLC